jgi:hypothetical protein
MRIHWIALTGLTSALAVGQHVTSVYNRDTHAPFHLKKVTVESTVIGPMVRTDTLLIYNNPYNTLTEATLNFDLPSSGALGGFAYFYGQEYVAGRLLDKEKAWQIYTAITSRNRDPGIMEQWSPTTYHCQIYPIRRGQDLRVRLWTVGLLEPKDDQLALPKPSVPRAVSYYSTEDNRLVEPDWTVRGVKSNPILKSENGYRVAMNSPVEAISERFKDGRYYVAGLFRSDAVAQGSVVIEEAHYEPRSGNGEGADVTEKVASMVAGGMYEIPATNGEFGDPNPNILKRLRVKYKLGSNELERVVAENQTLGLLTDGNAKAVLVFNGLHEVKTVQMDQRTTAFAGWMPGKRAMSATVEGKKLVFKPTIAPKGSDTARIWAQQMLASNHWEHEKALKFSLKYGVPSDATALLAVPKAEMRAYEAREAEARRAAREQSRQGRNWSGNKNQNWNASGGGDPEIRVSFQGAKSVEAILPDRRVIELTANGEVWGGNFEIPANAPEGTYKVRVVAKMADGTVQERSWTYDVDRTPPKGTAQFVREGAMLVVEVKSEPGLAEVAAYAEDGRKWVLKETKPGVYRVELPSKLHLTVVMKDRAGNKGELKL